MGGIWLQDGPSYGWQNMGIHSDLPVQFEIMLHKYSQEHCQSIVRGQNVVIAVLDHVHPAHYIVPQLCL